MKTTVSIKRASVRDAQEILRVQKEAFLTEADACGEPDIAPLRETILSVKNDFNSKIFLKALSPDGKIIGSVRASEKNGVVSVGRLAVVPAFRRQGVGTALARAIEKYFPLAVTFELFTAATSAGNIKLYESLGYRVKSRKKVTEKLTFVIMVKKAAEKKNSA
jgi:ribosomal protein S18 acetylase RimI-like enzyme